MKYSNFKDIKLSRLGMGNMRLPVIENKDENIDYDRAKAIIDLAMKNGINYYDTAYIYHGGKSEEFTGRALAEYPRDSYYVATKFNLSANPDYRAQLDEQLSRLGMDRIDFYLLHGLDDGTGDASLTNGCVEYFEEARQQGKITYLGFSFHGSPAYLRKIIKAHDWDFVQIQLNYYDWYYGDAKELYEILAEADIPVMVMEPVHGGMLANLGEPAAKLLADAAPERSQASWAMRWVASLEKVCVVLSGMNTTEQLEDNLATFDEALPLSDAEQALVARAAELQHSEVAVLCTACRYCCADCPSQLDIPALLKAYNDAKLGGAWRLSSLMSTPREKLPIACIGCGVCTSHCPQKLDVPAYMSEMKDMLAGFGVN